MQNIKYLKKLLGLVLLILIQSTHASIVEKECGGTIFQIKIHDNGSYNEYKLFYKVNEKESKFLYEPAAETIGVACIKNNEKRDLLLMEEVCRGRACPEIGLFTLFDPQTKKMLVKYTPNEELTRYVDERQHNSKIAKLVGRSLPLLAIENPPEKFCCERK